MIIAVRSFDFVDLLAETTIAPVVDTSATAVSRVESSAVLSRSHNWGMLTDMAMAGPERAKVSPCLLSGCLRPVSGTTEEARWSLGGLGPLASSSPKLYLTSSRRRPTAVSNAFNGFRLIDLVVWRWFLSAFTLSLVSWIISAKRTLNLHPKLLLDVIESTIAARILHLRAIFVSHPFS